MDRLFRNAHRVLTTLVLLLLAVSPSSGQALDIGRRGDADVVFVHDKEAEEKFVADGFGVKRHEVMYNDFVVVGPKSDPAGVAGKDIQAGLRRIAAVKAPFVSRGDRSGTHAAELRFWRDAGLNLEAIKGDWYKEIGQGMGPALNTASAAPPSAAPAGARRVRGLHRRARV